ncbi:MAG: 16S rRNA (adenine(1518)-N(6)/adenine(1519)-N(6))-dimethyltransferase RsmA [Clostridia bacterium]
MKDTRKLLDQFGIRLTKRLGQNFLIDEDVVEHIVEGAGVSKDDLAIEIGPGAGSMTRVLSAYAGEVLAIEIDQKLIPVLEETLADCSNVSVINEDAMKVDFKKLVDEIERDEEIKEPTAVKVVANLPYYITTPIIMKLLEEHEIVTSMTFMVQKEVADRMCAPPACKDYGALTLAVNYYASPQRLFDVSPKSFFPQPDVTSTVIRLDRHASPPVEVKSREMLFKVIKASFGQRRKTLHNALCNSGAFPLDRAQMAEMLVNIGIDPGCRGETLRLSEFALIANQF